MPATDAMIVAGGQGTRLAPLTDTCPKPLMPLAGVPFLQGQIARLANQGIRRVWLVVGADTNPFGFLVDHFGQMGVTVELVPEPRPLDTAGGVRAAIDATDGPVVVCNGDVLTDVDVQGLVSAHERVDAAATLSVIRVRDTSTYGVCVREGTRIVDFVEKPAPGTLPGQDTVNAGTYVLSQGVLDRFEHGPLSFERTVFPCLVEVGAHVESVVWEGVWGDLGTPTRWLRGQRQVLDEVIDWPVDPALQDRGGGVLVHPSATIHDEAVVTGPVVVGAGVRVDRARVGPHVVAGRDAVVGDGARVDNVMLRAGAAIDVDVVADACLLGVGATLRGPGTAHDVVLADGVTVRADAVAAGARLRAASAG